MALLSRQTPTYQYFDDQSPTMWNSFVGSWTRYANSTAWNGTLTATSTIGASFSFSFSGSQASLIGDLSNTTSADEEAVSYPIANYTVDGSPVDFQIPQIDMYGRITYFQALEMTDGDHNIDVVVTSASETNQFIVDYFSILPGAGGSNTSNNSPSSTETSSGSPTAATHSTPVGPIAGAVIGAVVLLVIALWYLRKRRSHTYNKPGLGGTLPDEAQTKPLSPAISPGLGGPGSQSAHSRPTIIGSFITGTRSGRTTTVVTQDHPDAEQPIPEEDARVILDGDGEQEPDSPQVPNEIPPAYTPH